MIPTAQKSRPTVTAEGELIQPDLIAGLRLKTVRNVPTRNGVLTELWRPEWFGPETRPGHVTYVTIAGFGETNWHCHQLQDDLIFVVRGLIKIAFYDDRTESPTYRRLNVLPFSPLRPTLIGVPPGIWHALKNADGVESVFITMNSRAFDYEDPDDWRLPPGDASLPRPF